MSQDNLKRVIELCYQMLEVADYGDRHRTSAGEGIVYGRLRDAAYKIRVLAEKEIKKIKAARAPAKAAKVAPKESESA